MFRIAVATILAVFSVLGAAAQPAGPEISVTPLDPALAAASLSLTGRITDPEGAPVSGAEVRWWEQERPAMLRSTDAPPAAATDADGHFTVQLPTAHVHYTVQVSRHGYESLETQVFRPDSALALQLNPLPQGRIYGTVSGDAHADTTVTLLGGPEPRTVNPGAGGAFAFENVPIDHERYGLFAESGDQVSPMQLVHPDKEAVTLALGAPGALEGVVADDSASPVPDATIAVTLQRDRAVLHTLQTDDAGAFQAAGLPPGTYALAFAHDSYAENSGRRVGASVPTVGIQAGENRSYQMTVFPTATVTGTILDVSGAPVAGAWVGLDPEALERAPIDRSPAEKPAPVQSDAGGKFTLQTPYTARSFPIAAYHPDGGGARASVYVPDPGKSTEPLHLQLRGAIRVHGTVTDPAGSPLAGVALGHLTTDASGFFDSGLIALPALESPALPLEFLAPRPGADPAGAPPARFYLHRTVHVQPHAGDDIRLDVQLEPTRAIRIAGTATLPNGDPAASAEVTFELGKSGRTGWYAKRREIDSLLTAPEPEDFRNRRGRPRYTTAAGAQGEWSLVVPMETQESMQTAYDGQGMTIAATLEASYGNGALNTTAELNNLATLSDETRFDLTLAYPRLDPATTVELTVVDPDGQPLPGIEWHAKNDANTPPAITDERGKVRLDFKRHRLVELASEVDWYVVSPAQFSGRVLDSKYMREPPPHHITLGKPGSFEFRTRYTNGELAPVSARIGEQSLREKTTYTPEGIVVDNLPPGPLTLTLRTNGGFHRTVDIVVPPGGRGNMEVDVPTPTCTISGTVRDTTGAPQPELYVQIIGNDYAEGETTGPDGTYTFEAPPGAYALLTKRNWVPCLYGEHGKTITIEPNAINQTLDLTVTAPAVARDDSNAALPATLKLHVTDAGGNPRAGLNLTATHKDRVDVKLSGATDQTGYLAFERVQPGIYRVVMEPDGHYGVHREFDVAVEEGEHEIRELPLAGARVYGRINGLLDASDVDVEIWNLAAGTRLRTRATPDGRFELTGVPQGFSTLRYHYDGMGLDRREPIVIGERMRPINLDLPGGRIEGRLPELTGGMMHDGRLRVVKLGPDGGYQNVDDDGLTFVADLLEDGDYQARFEVDRRVVAQSDVLTIKNGIAISNVTLNVDPAQLPNTPQAEFLRRRLEHQSSASK